MSAICKCSSELCEQCRRCRRKALFIMDGHNAYKHITTVYNGVQWTKRLYKKVQFVWGSRIVCLEGLKSTFFFFIFCRYAVQRIFSSSKNVDFHFWSNRVSNPHTHIHMSHLLWHYFSILKHWEPLTVLLFFKFSTIFYNIQFTVWRHSNGYCCTEKASCQVLFSQWT